MLTKRAFWLILLLWGGVGSFVYGTLFHRITIYEEKDREVTIAVPKVPDMEGLGSGLPSQTAPPDETENPSAVPSDGADRGKDPFQSSSGGAGDKEDPFQSRPSGEDHGKDPFQSPPSPADGSQLDKNPAENPDEPPPSSETTSKKITVKVLEPIVEPEGAIVLDVTIGGITRLADGRLKRTYSGCPPALCPT